MVRIVMSKDVEHQDVPVYSAHCITAQVRVELGMPALYRNSGIVKEGLMVGEWLNLDGPVVFGSQSVALGPLFEMVDGSATIPHGVETVSDGGGRPSHHHPGSNSNVGYGLVFQTGL